MLVYFSSHYIQYVVLLIPRQPDRFSLSHIGRVYSTSYEKFGTTKMAIGKVPLMSVLSDNNIVSSVLLELRSDSVTLTILMVVLAGRSSKLSNSGS